MMKNRYNHIWIGLLALLGLVSCSDFDNINRSPFEASDEQVQVEYFINNAIISAQMDPHIAERAFVLYWKNAGHMDRGGSINFTRASDGWSTDYYNYLTTWLTHINAAIELYKKGEANNSLLPYHNNLYQVSRIWRVYLMSEFADNFGAMPLDGFQGGNFTFSTVEEVYKYMLNELKEATVAFNAEKVNQEQTNFDSAYGFDFDKWRKYGNSLRMRLAMRLSEVDEALAKSHFEEAVRDKNFIAELDDIFSVQERPGWDALTGVMSREWNMQYLSTTLNNLYTGLGGITSEAQIGDYAKVAVKKLNDANKDNKDKQIVLKFNDPDWMGVKWEDHFSTKTNDPSAGFWNDGLNHIMDPRAYKAYNIPGDVNNPQFNKYPSWAPTTVTNTVRPLLDPNSEGKKDTLVLVNSAFAWNAPAYGEWGDKGAINNVRGWAGNIPRLVNKFRNSSMRRVFFGSWESYFLIAEASLRGWNVPMSGKEAYERGVKESFAYWDKEFSDRPISQFLPDYLASQSYNRAGTSVSWDHTAEPPASITIRYKDGKDGAEKSGIITYPTNHLYKNGAVKNDHLTKIITQKFIAQVPWLPLETWSDHRRLGLPFFENPVIEKPIEGFSALTESNYMESRWEFFPQRLKYPSALKNNAPEKYKEALSKLGGADEVSTKLYWAGSKK